MDIDDLLNEWRNFNLREKEKEHTITLDSEEVKEIRGNLNHNLVGKLLSTRTIFVIAIKNALYGAWKTRKYFKVETIGNNIFAFKFASEEDRKWVSNNGPWLFDKHLLILETPLVNQRTTNLDFKMSMFWTRLINLPMDLKNESITKKLGDYIREFLEMDCERSEMSWGISIRIKVRIDISKPLLRGFMLKALGVEDNCWITIRYERLPISASLVEELVT